MRCAKVPTTVRATTWAREPGRRVFQMHAQKFACWPLVVLEVKEDCRRVAELMSQYQIQHLPVLDEGVPVGMGSDRDLLPSIGWWGNNPKHPDAAISHGAERLSVGEVMSRPLICVAPDESLEIVARRMLNKRISAIPVV